jgi:hypothetical protein
MKIVQNTSSRNVGISILSIDDMWYGEFTVRSTGGSTVRSVGPTGGRKTWCCSFPVLLFSPLAVNICTVQKKKHKRKKRAAPSTVRMVNGWEHQTFSIGAGHMVL